MKCLVCLAALTAFLSIPQIFAIRVVIKSAACLGAGRSTENPLRCCVWEMATSDRVRPGALLEQAVMVTHRSRRLAAASSASLAA